MNEPIITVSGLRGIVGETLTPEVAARYAMAFAAEAADGEILVARDSRPSGEMLASAVHAGMQAVGRTTIDAGIAATPTVGILVRRFNAAGAVQITASHNPPQYNGMKLFSAEGRVISAGPGQKILERYRATAAGKVRPALGGCRRCDDAISDHWQAVAQTVDVERIRRRRFRVLLDSNHGAGGILGRRLLEELGCRTTIIGEEPNGRFAHPAEPTAENLAGVLKSVVEHGADIGFCQDPDADRLAVIDRAGRYLGEEYTLAICVEHVLRQSAAPGGQPQANAPGGEKSGTTRCVVTNCASSRMSQDVAERYGAAFHRAAVGEANVADAMLERGAIFGGEGNGGPIDPRVGYVRDSFAGMALLLDAMAFRDAPIDALAAELPRYEIVKTKAALPPDKLPAALDALERRFSDAAADRLDGLRLDWPDRWLLVRGSNTEPIVRAIAEAPNEGEAVALCRAAAEVLHSIS